MKIRPHPALVCVMHNPIYSNGEVVTAKIVTYSLRLVGHTFFKRTGFLIGAKYLCLSRQYFKNTLRKINTLT